MYARVTTIHVQPNKTEEAIRLVRDEVLPIARQQRGFHSLNLLADADAGRVLAISYWQTEDDLVASESVGYFEEQVAKFGYLLAGLPIREIYDVRL